MTFVDFVKEERLGDLVFDEYFKNLTTIGVGGKIKVLFYPNDIDSLRKAFKFVNDNCLEYFILGNGSNILASDHEYNGIVFYLKNIKYNYELVNDNILYASAFYPSNKLAVDLMNQGVGDLSCLAGIPGLLGGAIYNNSGSYNDNIGNYIYLVEYIDTLGNIKEINNNMCAFGYRRSVFKFIEGIIIGAKLHVKKEDTKAKLNRNIKMRLESQPVKSKSMGSIFKNNPLIPSWKIIDSLGLRGFQIGDAAISQKHSNFIINLGNAKASDIKSLIELIETRSRLELGIRLVKEIEYIN